jgi:hypothetical protein
MSGLLQEQKRGAAGVMSGLLQEQKRGAARAFGAASTAATFLTERDAVFKDVASMFRTETTDVASIFRKLAEIATFPVHGEFVDARLRAIRLPEYDVGGLLKPTPSRAEVVRSTDSIFDAIAELARDAPLFDDSTEEPKQSGIEWGDRDTGSRLWMPSDVAITRGEIPAARALEPIPVFCGHDPKDKPFRKALLKHLSELRHNGIIRTWHEGEILPGEDMDMVFWQNLELAKIVLLLISADYVERLYKSRMMSAMEQKSKRAHVIPILVRPTYIIEGTFLNSLSPLPSNGTAITRWDDKDEAWVHVVQRIAMLVEGMRSASRRLWA